MPLWISQIPRQRIITTKFQIFVKYLAIKSEEVDVGCNSPSLRLKYQSIYMYPHPRIAHAPFIEMPHAGYIRGLVRSSKPAGLLGATLTFVVLLMSINAHAQIVEGPPPGDYGGQDLIINQAPGVVLGGSYTGVRNFEIAVGVTVFVRGFNGNDGNSGQLTVNAKTINVLGAINANGSGWGGAGGGAGGGGGNGAPSRAVSGSPGYGAGGDNVPGVGGNDGDGGNGANGAYGAGYGFGGPLWFGGGAGGAGGAGQTGGNNGVGRDLPGKPANGGPNDGADGRNGGNGGYQTREGNGDTTLGEEIFMGSGGGSGGGGGGGAASRSRGGGLVDGTVIGGGGGGGAGGGGGPGGGIVRLIASRSIYLSPDGYIASVGMWGDAGASGTAGNRGTSPTKLGGIGGNGGVGYARNTVPAGGGLGGNGRSDGQGRVGGRGGDGGDGGSGAGGGILLRAPRLEIRGQVNNPGGIGAQNGGTIKMLFGLDGKVAVGPMTTGRYYEGSLAVSEYTLPTPSISPVPSAPFTTAVTVSLINNAPDVPDLYMAVTTDGSEPTSASPRYSGPFTVTSPTTVRTRAFARGWYPSSESSAKYDFLALPPLVTLQPTAISESTWLNTVVQATLAPEATQSDAVLRYEVGYGITPKDPTESSPVYQSGQPIPLVANGMLKVRAFRAPWQPSTIVQKTIRIRTASPLLSKANGYGEPQPFLVDVTNPTLAPSEVWYTLNSGDPAPGAPDSKLVTNGRITVLESGVYRFKAFKAGWDSSDVVVRTYNITGGDLTFSPFDSIEYISDRPIQVKITSPNQSPNLKIRVVTTGDVNDPANPSKREIPNGGLILITNSPTTLKAVAFGPNIPEGAVKSGIYRNTNAPAAVGTPIQAPIGSSFAKAPQVRERVVTESTTGGGILGRYHHAAYVPDAPGGGQVFGVVEGFEPDLRWWFPEFETFIQFEQTILPPVAEDIVTLYHTEDTPPALNQSLTVSLGAVPSSVIHYANSGILGLNNGRTLNDTTNVWIDLSAAEPLLRAKAPSLGRFVLELRDTPVGSATPGFRGMQVVRVKPYEPDAPSFRANLGSELLPFAAKPKPAVPRVLAGLEKGTFNGFIYQHDRVGQGTHGKLFAIRRNDDQEFRMEVLWRHVDRYERISWPYEIRRYTAQWPDHMQLYVRSVQPDPEGPHVLISNDLNPILVPYQEPLGHAQLGAKAGSAIFQSEVPSGSADGKALIFYDLKRGTDGQNWIGFEAVRSVRNSDPRFDLKFKDWDIGSEVTHTIHPGPYPEYLPGYIHKPDGGVLAGLKADRYAEDIYGTYGTEYSSNSPNTTGQIIGVNIGNLEVWWSNARKEATWAKGLKVQWPSLVARYSLRWPKAAVPLVLANQSIDSPPHNIDPANHFNSSIYYQNDPNEIGYNPNEEHAFLGQGSQSLKVYALRNDLGRSDTSEPYVLHQYQIAKTAGSGWRMRVYHVTVGDPSYPGLAGTRVQPPLPLSSFFDIRREGVLGPYWEDRKKEYWAKAAGDDGGEALIVMHYWYPAQVSNFGFIVPGKADLTDGELLPWLDLEAQKLGQASKPGVPINVNYHIRWPENVPTLQLGETLVKPKRGLPDIAGQKSVEVLYEQQRNPGELVRLIDPVVGYSVPLDETALSKTRKLMLPTKFYFEDLPSHLQKRLYYDRLKNTLVFGGAFLAGGAAGFGEDYLQLNVISTRDQEALLRVPPPGADGAKLRAAFSALSGKANSVRLVGSQDQAFEMQALTAGFALGEGFVTLAMQNNTNKTTPADPVSLEIIRVSRPWYVGEIKVIYPPSPFDEKLTLRHSGDFAGKEGEYEFEWRTLPAGLEPGYREDPAKWANRGITNAPSIPPEQWVKVATTPVSGLGALDYTIQGASLLTLGDNWFICRYKPLNAKHPLAGTWSEWTRPALAEGWIKRVIKGNNEFNLGLVTQVEELFRSYQTATNRVLATMIGLAGGAYEGNVALNLSSAKDAGLIQIYETVLRRGISLSIGGTPPLDYDPANTALLLAASRLAYLYGLLGNEAYADAVDPSLTFGTYNGQQIGALSTSVHAFQNQTTGINSLLQEELALLRGRADPGVRPFYNRLPPNFTSGPGEAAYVMNYGINDVNGRDGTNADDAAQLYPQGHGDSWGHYLSGLKVYYRLLRNPAFTWVPRSETVNIVVDGQSSLNVEVDYQDERRFAELAAAKARAGVDLVNLTYRNRYTEDPSGQWQGYKDEDPKQAWGLSEWAARAGQGALLDWAVASSLLPDEDNNPGHVRDVQKIDRGRIRELAEVASAFRQIQIQLDQADGGLNPLGVSPNAVPFDLDPNQGGNTHFEQMEARAERALKNAGLVFAASQGAGSLLREQFDAVEKFSNTVRDQETSYRNQLIEIFGYPYPSDTGKNRGGIYSDDYVDSGPDLYHFMYVDPSRLPGLNRGGESEIDLKMLGNQLVRFADGRDNKEIRSIHFQMSTEGFGMVKPKSWKGERKAPGEIQRKMSDLFQSYGRFLVSAREYDNLLEQIEDQKKVITAQAVLNSAERSSLETEISILTGANQRQVALNAMIAQARAQQVRYQNKAAFANIIGTAVAEAYAFTTGNAGPFPVAYWDVTAVIRSAIRASFSIKGQEAAEDAAQEGLEELSQQQAKERVQNESAVQIRIAQRGQVIARGNLALESARAQLNQLVRSEASRRVEMYNLMEAMQQAADEYLFVLDKGVRLLEDVDRFRIQTAGELQKYRYRDLLFRMYRNDGIQKYRSQFEVAGRYAYLAAKAYDYETCLLPADSLSGQRALADIVRARSIGLMDGEGHPLPPATIGDPGLAGALGRMRGDYDSVRGRYGLNNPTTSTLRFSLRREHFRLTTPGAAWRDILQAHRVTNLLENAVYNRYCAPSHDPASTREPALVIPFGTTIQDGLNFFGMPKAGGDSTYSAAYYATKVRSVGVGLIGYNNVQFPKTPHVYLVPVGTDIMRVPGKPVVAREFYVVDQIVPFPSAITGEIVGRDDYLPIVDSISTPSTFASIRRIPDFLAYYDGDGYDAVTKSNRRLIGRSVWNTQWVLILRGRELGGADPDESLDDLILGPRVNGVRSGGGLLDLQITLETDSYSGN